MPRPKAKINPICGKRLKELCETEGITQVQLAKEVFLSQQTVSKIIKGHSSMTEETARRVHDKYPAYPFEWLMGYSDYKTTGELLANTISQCQREGDLLMVGFRAFAQLSGYDIKFTSPPTLHGEKRSAPVEEWLKMVKDGYTIYGNGKTATISIEELNRLQNEICDFVEFKLNRLCEKGGKNG